ncbi:major capsid protein [Mycolicibacterium iranicum]|uniref:Major capsid protein n=1 Tax=Mycolicibacterium iranicum TaxID=912594 RepID=A0ABT4HQS7_MYCIR|nr:major capsid protein [Mycolicibacterium iranicum]MCZ0732318.1 hypothetical protein [Mycolicibacterium iranicum]
MTYLLPSLTGNNLTVDAALKSPTTLLKQIAKIADSELLLPLFTHQLGTRLTGGGLLYSTINRENLYTASDVEQRSPGAEYPVTAAVRPEPQLSKVEDWGGKALIPDEAILRNNISLLDQETIALGNTIARKVDQLLMREVELAIANLDGAGIVIGNDWSDLQLFGPDANLTPTHDLPTADFAKVALAMKNDDMGFTFDTLVVNPSEEYNLKVAYADKYESMLKSAGIELFSSTRIEPGVGWAIQKGRVGTVGFEFGLTVEVIDDRERRQKKVQAYVVPAVGIDQPLAMKKLTGLAG